MSHFTGHFLLNNKELSSKMKKSSFTLIENFRNIPIRDSEVDQREYVGLVYLLYLNQCGKHKA